MLQLIIMVYKWFSKRTQRKNKENFFRNKLKRGQIPKFYKIIQFDRTKINASRKIIPFHPTHRYPPHF